MQASDILPDEARLKAIRRDIDAYEAERVSARRGVFWRLPLGLLLLFSGVGGLAWSLNALASPYEQWLSTPHVFLYAAAFAGFWLTVNWATRPARRMQQAFRDRVLPLAFGFVEGVRYTNGEEPASFARLPRSVLPHFDRRRFDDGLSGRHAGFAFDLVEAELADRDGKTEHVRFKGVIVAFALETAFPGELVATRKAGRTPSFLRDLFGPPALDTVDSGDAALDAIYDFRTDNAEAAGPLVRGDLAQALAWLGEAWPDEPGRLALKGSDGFLLLPTERNFFELPPVAEPLDYRTHIAPLIADLGRLLATAALIRKVGARR